MDLLLKLAVDGGQLFVDRLQFLLGGFQFFVGGLEFLVAGNHFLVGHPQFLVRRLEVVDRGLEVVLRGLQFVFELPHGGFALAGLGQFDAGDRGPGNVLEDHGQQRLRFAPLRRGGDGDANEGAAFIPRDRNALQHDRLAVLDRLVHGRPQFQRQPRLGDFQQVQAWARPSAC